MPDAEYAFLETVSESQAIAAGFNLTDKFNHALYRKIQQVSNPGSARRKIFFTAETMDLDGIGSVARKDLISILKRLSREKLIVQLLRFECQNDSGLLTMLPYFIARPHEKSDSRQIFVEAISQSADAFIQFMRAHPITKDLALQDFQYDLASNKDFSKANLKSILEMETFVNIRLFDIVPDGDLINTTIADIRQELLETARLLEVPGYGLLRMVDVDAIQRFELAADFLIDKVIPRYRSHGNCKRELEKIAIEEATYHLDDFVPVSPEFIARRATEVKKAVQFSTGRSGAERFPGSLVVETLLSLTNIVKEKYLELTRAENDRVFDDFKKKLVDINSSWEDAILFIDQKKMTRMNPVTWNRLVADPDLLYGIWELPHTSMHVFVRRRSSAFRKLVNGMTDSFRTKEWQVLAMKDLLENYEDYFRELFLDKGFVQTYGILLRRAYIPYMPWYLRILLIFEFKPVLDLAFQAAKKKITQTQAHLKAMNYDRYLEILREREEERFKKKQQIQRLTLSNRIIDCLDNSYFNQKGVPTVGQIRRELHDVSDNDLDDVLRADRFQMISLRRSDKNDERILLYPMDSDWKAKSSQLATLFATIEKERAGKEDDEFQIRELDKIRRLHKIVEREPGTARLSSDSAPDDPYLRLEKEIRKQKTRKPWDDGFEFDI